MVTRFGQRVGVAAIRVWVERGDPPELRVRITHCDDVTDPVWVSAAFGSARAGAATIHEWLEEFHESRLSQL